MIRPCLCGDTPRRDARVPDLHEQALGGVEQRVLGLCARACRSNGFS
jgi:hypothetical protein